MSPKRREFNRKRSALDSSSDESTIAERVAKRRREFDTGRPAKKSSTKPLARPRKYDIKQPASTSDQREGITKQEFERKIASANALVDRITKYLNDYDVDLLFMGERNYFTNFKEYFENFKKNILKAQQDFNHRQISSTDLTQSQKSLEILFNGGDTIKNLYLCEDSSRAIERGSETWSHSVSKR